MAVYTAIDEASLGAFLAAYDLGPAVQLQGIAEGVENSNYLLVTERGRFILTIYEKRVDPAELPFFLGLMDHLAARGVPCPTPVHGRDGEALRHLCGRPAAVVSFLEGVSPRRVRAAHCAALGAALADLHLAGDGFDMARPNALSVSGWRALFETCRADADRVLAGLEQEIDRELTRIEREWPDDLPRGVIHADLFPDNVFFQGDRLTGIIDFYFACVDLVAYDLAICLNAWCFEPDGAFNITKARHMLAAYRARRGFTPRELAALPLLARGAALRFLLTRLFDWQNRVEGALVKPKDPLEYLHKLRFHRTVTGPGAYGLD
ncbi:MAG TPA: homoserine kinase [Geminicoccaceae bacterium]|jgi:homoserine kinase type II|nr:homoserine kinase [Geminicoccaceae bacterium]